MELNIPTNNQKLSEILKSVHDDVTKNFPTFDQYYPDARPRYVLQEKKNRTQKFKNQLKKLEDEFRLESSKKQAALNQLRNGNLVNESYSSSSLRQIAVLEFNSAILLADSKPENIDEVIVTAAQQKRSEFIFSLETILAGQSLGNLYNFKVQGGLKKAKEILGYTKLENEISELNGRAAEVSAYLTLLENDLEVFIQKSAMVVRVDEAMGQSDSLKPIVDVFNN